MVVMAKGFHEDQFGRHLTPQGRKIMGALLLAAALIAAFLIIFSHGAFGPAG